VQAVALSPDGTLAAYVVRDDLPVDAVSSSTVGSVTPPVGVLAMVASRIAGISYNASLGMLSPFIAAWMGVILLIAYVPELVLWLPRLMR